MHARTSRRLLPLGLAAAGLVVGSPAAWALAEAGMTAPTRTTVVEDDSIEVDDPPATEVGKDDGLYRPVAIEAREIVWYDPGQRGLIEANPLVMGLAAMALATVTLLFFFLRGVKRPGAEGR